MAIPRHSEALQTATRIGNQLPDRIEAFLNAQMLNGIVGGVIAYGGAVPRVVTAVVNGLAALGWTVAQDDANQILTIS